MKKIIFFTFFIITSSSWAIGEKTPTLESRMIEKITKANSICNSCKFITRKINSNWIKNHILYEVTTFDILPPPAWHIAVFQDKNISLLTYRDVDVWNEMIQKEKIKISTNEDILKYAQFFLSMTMSQSEFIETLLKGEIEKIESKTKKKVDPKPSILKTGEKTRILFYAHDHQGDLQEWTLIFSSSGSIFKVQERSF